MRLIAANCVSPITKSVESGSQNCTKHSSCSTQQFRRPLATHVRSKSVRLAEGFATARFAEDFGENDGDSRTLFAGHHAADGRQHRRDHHFLFDQHRLGVRLRDDRRRLNRGDCQQSRQRFEQRPQHRRCGQRNRRRGRRALNGPGSRLAGRGTPFRFRAGPRDWRRAGGSRGGNPRPAPLQAVDLFLKTGQVAAGRPFHGSARRRRSRPGIRVRPVPVLHRRWRGGRVLRDRTDHPDQYEQPDD
jgi:hypothetical protein